MIHTIAIIQAPVTVPPKLDCFIILQYLICLNEYLVIILLALSFITYCLYVLGSSVHPDAAKTVIPVRQHRSILLSRTESLGSPVEKVPMLSTGSYPAQPHREYYMQISPNGNCDHHDYMQIGKKLFVFSWLSYFLNSLICITIRCMPVKLFS